MSNNLDAPNIKYVKCMKWTLNRINYKIYTILMLLWDNVRDTYQIQYIFVNIIIAIVEQ